MRFIDEATITVKAGKGGDGSTHYYRAAFIPKGGPDGGDGGRGGSVILIASNSIGTLSDVALRRIYKAPDGKPGQGNRMSGRSGRDITIELPVGTVIYESETNEIAADLTVEGESIVIAKGGRGGRGNVHFATSRNQTPRRAENGKPGEERSLRLELKLLADVGLVGRPNAGKSTLLRALSRATPKTGDYPFTTLSPALGVVPVGSYDRFTIADIPGLIEGARFGRGLGHRFLRHIERTNLILIMIDTQERDYRSVYETLIEDLEGYSAELAALPRLVIRSKSDLSRDNGEDFHFDLAVSAFSGEGLGELKQVIASRLGIPSPQDNA